MQNRNFLGNFPLDDHYFWLVAVGPPITIALKSEVKWLRRPCLLLLALVV